LGKGGGEDDEDDDDDVEEEAYKMNLVLYGG
jgi:hypothetical protein